MQCKAATATAFSGPDSEFSCTRDHSGPDHGNAIDAASSAPRQASDTVHGVGAATAQNAEVLQSSQSLGLATSMSFSTKAFCTRDNTSTPSELISNDIVLTTTIDHLALDIGPASPAFDFFLEYVESPAITPFDRTSWCHVKREIVNMSTRSPSLVTAVQMTEEAYQAQLFGFSYSKSIALYHLTRAKMEGPIPDQEGDSSCILLITLLLCLTKGILYDQVPPLIEMPGSTFSKNLQKWAQEPAAPHDPTLLRIAAWIRLLHTTAIRGGGPGILPSDEVQLLPAYRIPTERETKFDGSQDAAASLVQLLSQPVFSFYLSLQMISTEIATLTHYHRSRVTGDDQDEVGEHMAHIETSLTALWDSRSHAERLEPAEIRHLFCREIADEIICLIGLCRAAYYAEMVEMGRVLGDPIEKLQKSQNAIAQIRFIIDGDWNAFSKRPVNPGYLRPLFLCAIESTDRGDTDWAIERLGEIRNPICRSDFFAVFAKQLCSAQHEKGRRVTSKYFCIQRFGIVPPYL